MIDSPWQSIWLKQHGTEKIASELAKAKVTPGALQVAEDGDVIIITPYAQDVPVFYIPITENELGGRKLFNPGAIFVDGRSFMKKSTQIKGETVTNNQTTQEFTLRAAKLIHYWFNAPTARLDLMRTSDLPATAFTGWISSEISSKLGLDADTLRTLQIITATFYAHLYHAESEVMSERGQDKVIRLVSRWTRHPLDKIDIVKDLAYMRGMTEYVDEVKRIFSSNTRIAMISTGLLISSLNRGWFGAGANELMTVAIEYPPVWLALVEAASNSKVYKKTGLGRVVERYSRATMAADFSKSLDILLLQGI